MTSDSQLMPFTYSSYKNTPISAIEFYGDYAFAGISNSGLIIRSKSRYSWEKFYQTSDTNISALKISNGYLYIGTSPQGNIYRILMSTMSTSSMLSVESFGSMGSEIVDFAVFNNELYIAVNGPPSILKFNLLTSKFDFVYTPYAPVNAMEYILGKLYLAVEDSNIISFDGSNWKKIIMGDMFTNISSYRNISKEVYSHSNSSSINRSEIITTSDMAEEDVLVVMPVNRTDGVRSISGDGTSIVMGASNHSRFYRFLDENIDMIFDTEGNSIDHILNIDVGANLLSSANKVYLVYSGTVSSGQGSTTTPEVTTTTTTANPNMDKTVVITYPNGGENIQLGDAVNIQWSSTKGLNDAVKLELIQGSTVKLVINGQLSNSGVYLWEVPLSLAEGDYKIRITWLSAGTSDPNNVDESDETFSILTSVPVTTTTTTTAPNPMQPSTASTRGIPILILPEYESVTEMVKDDSMGGILLATSTGRILNCSMLTINGYLTGDRTVYANIYDGCGYMGEAQTVFNYSLYKKLVELNENKEIKEWKYDTNITGIKTEEIKAYFYGPVLYVRNDFGFWKELTWEETKPTGTDIVISLRSASSSEELLKAPWIYSTTSEDGEVGVITRSLNNVGLKGQYLQVKIEMLVNTKDITPSITNVTLNYSTRNSVYFFTNKFTIDLDNPAKKGLLTATISQPVNTEIAFGISSENTADWNKYQVVTPDKFFDLDNKEIKVGIKFTSYDDNLPVVSEFAVMAGGEILTQLNN